MAGADDMLKQILQDFNLETLLENFVKEKIDVSMIIVITDRELTRLGVETIGDRVRLREACKKANNISAESTSRSTSSSESLRNMITNERSLLFGRQQNKGNRDRKTRRSYKRKATWTNTVVCLANKSQKRVPSVAEKQVLFKAGLGCKKVKFGVEDTEIEIFKKLTEAFPQLTSCGGFELLQCRGSCRELTVIDCNWTVEELKHCIGAQSKIYVRPIQCDLSTVSTLPKPSNTMKQKCKGCHGEFILRELREHLALCIGLVSSSDEDLPVYQEFLSTGICLQKEETDVGGTQTFEDDVSGTQTLEDEAHETQTLENGANETQTLENSARETQTFEDGAHEIQTLENITPETQTFEDGARETQTIENGARETQTEDGVRGTHTLDDGVRGTQTLGDGVRITPTLGDGVHWTQTGDGARETRTLDDGAHGTQTLEGDAHGTQTLEDGAHGTSDTSASNQTTDGDGLGFLDANGSVFYDAVVAHCLQNSIHDPVDILRFLQSILVKGRPLDIEDEATVSEGTTNFIIVDRNNILTTGFEEIEGIEDLRYTLEVQFYGEVACDYGGPRKEFFRLILREIFEKYFEHGIRPFAEMEYKTIGKIVALSILQNGKIPKFLPVEEIFSSDEPSPCMKALQEGMDELGLFKIGSFMPIFQHLLRPSSGDRLTVKMLIALLKPDFSEEGSNRRRRENAVYSVFVKYLREAASGRREPVTLEHVLMFTTGTDQEPVLGFKIHPNIKFTPANNSFLPMANTCINCLLLPFASTEETALPNQEVLFGLYDYAFANTYYGNH